MKTARYKLTRKGIMHCCTANGARTLYCVWDSIVQRCEDGSTTVNFLLNRASPWLDVASWLPVDGRVQLTIKDAPKVYVRMSEWVDLQAVTATVNGEAADFSLDGPMVCLEGLAPGDVVDIRFPVLERTLHRVIGEIPFRLDMRGANVVAIEPRGITYPLFDRPASGEVSEREVFVPTNTFTW